MFLACLVPWRYLTAENRKSQIVLVHSSPCKMFVMSSSFWAFDEIWVHDQIKKTSRICSQLLHNLKEKNTLCICTETFCEGLGSEMVALSLSHLSGLHVELVSAKTNWPAELMRCWNRAGVWRETILESGWKITLHCRLCSFLSYGGKWLLMQCNKCFSASVYFAGNYYSLTISQIFPLLWCGVLHISSSFFINKINLSCWYKVICELERGKHTSVCTINASSRVFVPGHTVLHLTILKHLTMKVQWLANLNPLNRPWCAPNLLWQCNFSWNGTKPKILFYPSHWTKEHGLGEL